MFKKIVFYDSLADGITGTWPTFFLQGIALIAFGLLILFVPQLLVAMVAGTFIFLGLMCLVIAFKTRNLKTRYRTWRDQYWDPL